jgi:hypothetical protein
VFSKLVCVFQSHELPVLCIPQQTFNVAIRQSYETPRLLTHLTEHKLGALDGTARETSCRMSQ